jgi:hypothetical protein
MEIHKPKPVHSLREFVSEIGVVVFGIAIALTGEQVLEGLHWHHVVETEREALKVDIQSQLSVVQARVLQKDCVSRRLGEIDQIFDRHHTGAEIRLRGPIGRPQNLASGREAWSIAISSQAASHMTLHEQTTYGAAYSNYENLSRLRVDADAEWVTLSALDKPERLDAASWSALFLTFQRLKAVEDRISVVAPYVLSDENVGYKPQQAVLKDVLTDPYSQAFCRPII